MWKVHVLKFRQVGLDITFLIYCKGLTLRFPSCCWNRGLKKGAGVGVRARVFIFILSQKIIT